MTQTKRNILITGLPGVGKTTLIKKLAGSLTSYKLAGFYTSEIREAGIRKGFELEDFTGYRSVLSHVSIKSNYKVGKYGVDIEAFDQFLDRFDMLAPDIDFILIDEIGKMECFSEKFIKIIEDVLKSNISVIATIAQKGGGMIENVKNRTDVTLLEITAGNRNIKFQELILSLQNRS